MSDEGSIRVMCKYLPFNSSLSLRRPSMEGVRSAEEYKSEVERSADRRRA